VNHFTYWREELERALPEDEQDKDDERPTVVVLKSGDLTAEEAEKLGVFVEEKDEDDAEDSSGRVMFKKPAKRPLEPSKEDAEKIRSKLEKRESSMKKVNNKTLLSFDDEEDDDDDSD
ncbi:hypothetical protein Ocin01_12466, partial [Orchesella cincta]